jgi:hypothetical protein
MTADPKEVSPHKVLAEVAAAVPAEVHPNIIVIGSLAAAYWLFRGDETFGVRTKDMPRTDIWRLRGVSIAVLMPQNDHLASEATAGFTCFHLPSVVEAPVGATLAART